MKKIQLNKEYYDFPEQWDDLSPKQLLQTMDVMFLKKYKAEQMLLKLVKVMTGISTYKFLKCDVEEAAEYFYLLKFLLQPEIDFTKNILPSYKFSHTEFYGPCDYMDNLKMKEFALTEDLYTTWFDSEKKDIEALDALVAILYRPAPAHYDFEKNPKGDKREDFNQNVSAYYAQTYVHLWPLNVKLAIATWYNGCRMKLVKNNPDVFAGGSGDPARYGLVSVMLEVAETHVFGDFEKVEEQNVPLIMMQLNESVDKAKRLKEASKT